MSVTRRAVLGAGLLSLLGTPALADSYPLLPPLPAGAPRRRLFAPLEQRFASYLTILPAMTNDIVTETGFMGGNWWRTPNAPYNARVQEHVYTLSWFYANARPWNPYSGNAALLARLDIAIGHYLSLQHSDGSWPEYNINERAKAATGFGMGYLAKTLANLRQARALPQRQAQIEAALRQGMTWFLNPATPIWGPPVEYANQNMAGLAGAALALRLTPDFRLASMLAERIEYIAEHGQSPAGFFYEPTGMDMNYNFEVMLPEMAEVYALTRNRTMVTMARRFTEWFGYNMVREPDGSGSIGYIGMSSRTSVSYYDDMIPDPDRTNLASLFVPEIPELGAFCTTMQDRMASRVEWTLSAAPVPVLAKQDTSPRIIAHARYGEALPTESAKLAAITRLPYLRSDDFALQRRDDRLNQNYCYVRRPELYLAGFWGSRPSSSVRGGPGLLWHPTAGMLVLSQQNDTQCWASVLPNGNPDARGNMDSAFFIGSQPWDGSRIAPGSSPLVVRYGLPDGRVRTVLTVTPNSVTRSVQGTTALTEQIPLVLLPTDSVALGPSSLTVRRGDVTITITWNLQLAATLTPTSVTFLRDAARRLHVLRIPHNGTLTTTLAMG